MELAINTMYTDGTVEFKNSALKKATLTIVSNMTKSKDAFVIAAMELARINDEKLYERDFIADDGKPSFALYVESVLGISKSAAYRIIKTGKTLLMPELVAKSREKYFENFADSTLAVIAQVGDYDKCKAFCEAFEISETTPRSEVQKYYKAYTNKEDPCANLDEYNERENAIDVSGETDDGENVELEKSKEIAYLHYIADMFRSNLNAALEQFDDPSDQSTIKAIVKKF